MFYQTNSSLSIKILIKELFSSKSARILKSYQTSINIEYNYLKNMLLYLSLPLTFCGLNCCPS